MDKILRLVRNNQELRHFTIKLDPESNLSQICGILSSDFPEHQFMLVTDDSEGITIRFHSSDYSKWRTHVMKVLLEQGDLEFVTCVKGGLQSRILTDFPDKRGDQAVMLGQDYLYSNGIVKLPEEEPLVDFSAAGIEPW